MTPSYHTRLVLRLKCKFNSSHVIGNRNVLFKLKDSRTSNIKIAREKSYFVMWLAWLTLPCYANHMIRQCIFESPSGEIKKVVNVLHVSRVKSNLFSLLGKFSDLGHLVLFNSRKYYRFNRNNPNWNYLQAVRTKNILYQMEGKNYHLYHAPSLLAEVAY